MGEAEEKLCRAIEKINNEIMEEDRAKKNVRVKVRDWEQKTDAEHHRLNEVRRARTFRDSPGWDRIFLEGKRVALKQTRVGIGDGPA